MASPAPVPYLVDQILEEIFLRLSTPCALARASTACTSFHRIITSRFFLRRFRKRHPPPLLGFANVRGFHPSEAPYPYAPLARAVLDVADFTYSFVPTPNKEIWLVRDIRDGRVLLEDYSPGLKLSRDLVVCDPLSQRYVMLPPIPRDLKFLYLYCNQMEPVLAPIGEDEDETSFKVICFANYTNRLVVFVFSSITQKWCIAASPSWSSLGIVCPIGWHHYIYKGCSAVSCFNCVRGCFYSASPLGDKFLMFDTRTLEISTINDRTGYHVQLRCLPDQERSLPAIVVGREGVLEMFSLVSDHIPNGSFDLYHTTLQSNDESSKEWQLENIIPLPEQGDYFIFGAAEGFLFLGVTTEDQVEVDYFSLEIQTLELKKICRMRKPFFQRQRAYSYFGFPPSLSQPSI